MLDIFGENVTGLNRFDHVSDTADLHTIYPDYIDGRYYYLKKHYVVTVAEVLLNLMFAVSILLLVASLITCAYEVAMLNAFLMAFLFIFEVLQFLGRFTRMDVAVFPTKRLSIEYLAEVEVPLYVKKGYKLKSFD